MNGFFSSRRGGIALIASCALASTPALSQELGGGGPGAGGGQEAITAARALPTPRLDGKPDLTGFWSTNTDFATAQNIVSADGKKIEFQIQPPFAPRGARAGGGGGGGRGGGPRGGGLPTDIPAGEATPPYKPELLAKVDALAKTDVDNDPSFVCNPGGVPRVGAPAEIFQSKDAVALLYRARDDFRVIPMHAGVKHDPTLDPSWNGDSIGRWEGETLVIDSVNFTDESWMAGGGRFHTDQMHVVERLTRQGNTLLYQVTVEDPGVLTRPWVMPPRTIVLGKAGEHIVEDAPCHDFDRPHMVDKYHITP